MRDDAVMALLGGPTVFGPDVTTDRAFTAMLECGLPSAALDAVRIHLVGEDSRRADTVGSLFSSVGLLGVTTASDGRLSPAISECLARLARAVVHAEEVLGSGERAVRWLTTPNRALDGQLPARLTSADGGMVVVEQLLGRNAHGVFS
ncbi:MAG: MbcA/ParS/Xre antitoxin family protein [Gemmatimonadota bacterium]